MSHTPPPGVPVVDPEPPTPTPRLWGTLSRREQEVALLLARGETNGEIAKALGVGQKTVDTFRHNALKKLQLRNNVMLVRYLVREGLVTL